MTSVGHYAEHDWRVTIAIATAPDMIPSKDRVCRYPRSLMAKEHKEESRDRGSGHEKKIDDLMM